MQIETPDLDRGRPVVLTIASLQFDRDVKALMKWGTKYTWAAVRDDFLVEEQRKWVPPRLQCQAYYVNESGPDVDAAWAQSKVFALGILQEAVKAGAKLAAVMSGNWDYWNEECMRLACEEMGLPFLVLMREHALRGIRKKRAEEHYGPLKRIPNVQAVAVAGPTTAELFEDLRLFPRSKLRVTGWPRHDVWRYSITPAYDRPVVLMSYYKGYDAAESFLEMMGRFSRLAARYPHIPFLLKAKHPVEVRELSKIARHRGLNLNIIDSASLPDVLSNARVVIGFGSVAMYEALLAPVPIVIPCWGQTDKDPATIVPSPDDARLRGHMEFIRSPEAFDETVTRYIEEGSPPLDMAARTRVFGEYFMFTPERTCVERVEDFVDEFGLKHHLHHGARVQTG